MNRTGFPRNSSAYYVSNFSYNYAVVQPKENGKREAMNILDFIELGFRDSYVLEMKKNSNL